MDISSVASAVSGAVAAPVDVATSVLRKSLDITTDQSMRLIQLVADQAGLGTNLDTTA